MAAEADGFGYKPHHSTTGVFCSRNGNDQVLVELRPDRYPLDRPVPDTFTTVIPQPFTILSSSCGFVLYRVLVDNSSCSYHIFNPLEDPLYGHLCLLGPPRPHNPDTPAVLSFDHRYGTQLSCHNDYYVICAVREEGSRYSFDTYSSKSSAWTSARGPIELDAVILLNTGVSCGRWAYWLTDDHRRPVVVKHDPDQHVTLMLVDDLTLPETLMTTRKMQLGRVGDNLGLVVVDIGNAVAEFWMLWTMHDKCTWGSPLALTRIVLENADDVVVVLEPLRFESHKLEILFSVQVQGSKTKRLVLWESSDFLSDLTMAMTRVVPVPVLADASGLDIANGVPYVLPLMPGRRTTT